MRLSWIGIAALVVLLALLGVVAFWDMRAYLAIVVTIAAALYVRWRPRIEVDWIGHDQQMSDEWRRDRWR